MRTTHAFLTRTRHGRLTRTRIERRDLRPDDVAIDVGFCGVCHSDLHAIEQGDTFPLVPGHEFTGVVSAAGAAVTRFRVGDAVAVGNIVDSCGACRMCEVGQENYCAEFPTLTYGGADRHDGMPTLGAYAGEYVASERFVYHLPEGLDAAAAAPLMCAGVTVWEPLRRWAGPGRTVGVVGLGGLGHLAIRFAHALGARVVLFTTSAAKAGGAAELGAHEVVVSTDPEAMAAQAGRLDVVLDTASAPHDLTPYLRTLALDGTLCSLGALGSMEFDPMALLVGRRSLASAGSGGRRGTQEMLDFCARHGITADVEVLPAGDVNEALDRLRRGDVRYRFVLDLRS